MTPSVPSLGHRGSHFRVEVRILRLGKGHRSGPRCFRWKGLVDPASKLEHPVSALNSQHMLQAKPACTSRKMSRSLLALQTIEVLRYMLHAEY